MADMDNQTDTNDDMQLPQMPQLQPAEAGPAAPNASDMQASRDADFQNIKDAHLQQLKRVRDVHNQNNPGDPLNPYAHTTDDDLDQMAEQSALKTLSVQQEASNQATQEKSSNQNAINQQRAQLGLSTTGGYQGPSGPPLPGDTNAGTGQEDWQTFLQKKEQNIEAPLTAKSNALDQMQVAQEQDARDRLAASQAAQVKLNALATNHQAYTTKFDTEMAHVKDDMAKGHIDPNQFMDNMSTGSKIATALGMLVAGAGSGLLHQENPVSKWLNSQVDRNIQAQKENLGQKNNIFRALLASGENERSSESFMRAMNLQMMKEQLDSIGAKTNLATAGPRIAMLKADIDQQIAQERNKYADSNMLSQGSQNGTLNPEMMDQEHRERYIPGFSGFAASKNDAEKFKEYLNTTSESMRAIERLQALAANPAAKFNPDLRAQAAKDIVMLRGATAKGIYSRTTENELKQLEVIKDPLAIFSIGAQGVLNSLSKSMNESIADRAQRINLTPVRRAAPPKTGVGMAH